MSSLADKGKRKDMATELQRELEREFLLEQLQELSADFADNPEQIGQYLADLEIAGLLTPADKGMIFRRLWETMGPAFADRAFGMTERALVDGDVLAAEIAQDAFASVDGGQALFSDRGEYERAMEATRALEALTRALGLKIDVARPEFKRRPDHIHDIDPERAAKTQKVLGSLGSQLGIDTNRIEVRADEAAREETAGQGIWGLMTDGTVFLDPDLYDPETESGRHLLAHEVVHVAQLENRLRGANDAPDLFQAEAEADELSAQFAQTGDIDAAPLASLARYDQAACGPREMTTPTPDPEPKPPRTETKVEIIPTYKIIEGELEVKDIYFKVDKYEVKDLEKDGSLDRLNKAKFTINSYPEIKAVEVQGHTSTTASYDYNMKLSQRRMDHIVKYLKSGEGKHAGQALTPVKADLTGVGYGEKAAREELKQTDPGKNWDSDKNTKEVTTHRKVVFKITNPGAGWKPTRQVVETKTRTTINEFDGDGNLIKTTIIENGVVVSEETFAPGQAPAQGGTSPATTTPGGGNTPGTANPPASGPATPAPAVVEPSIPGAGNPGGEATPPTTTIPTATGQIQFKAKIKPPKRDGKKPKSPRRYAAGTRQLMQAKAGAGGLTSLQMSERSSAQGAGERIPDMLRGRFESAFGADFSDVRIHRGSTQATGIGATAFARGSDIHFAPGRFDPDSSSGLAVLGHELTHIVQQRAGRVSVPQGKGTHVNVERTLEAEADLLGARAARGESVQVQGSSAALYSRAARGGADTIQYDGGAGASTDGAAKPEHAEVRLGGQRIRASLPGNSPGTLTIDFSSAASIPGLSLKQAQLTYNDQWEIERGHIMASVAVGEYVKCEDVRLEVTQKEDGSGKYAELAAVINDAEFKIDGVLTSKINLRLASSGISGSADVQFSEMQIAQGITLSGGSLKFELAESGEASVSGKVNGTVAVGAVTANVELEGRAMSDGTLTAGAKISLANPVPVPGVEGVTIKSGSIEGEYQHKKQWSVAGNLVVNVRDWVEADISANYKQPEEGDAEWELNGTLRQLQTYSIGEGDDAINFENGEVDFHFKNGEFLTVDARSDYNTTNWEGRLTGTFDVPAQKLTAQATCNLKPDELPIGDGGIKFTRVEATLTINENELETIAGGCTVVFPYEEQPTFELNGTDMTYDVKTSKITATATVTTLRELKFGDEAGYNGTVAAGASGTLSVADNQLLGISGGLSFAVNHAAEQIGEGTVDVNFEGPSQTLNAHVNFTLTAEGGLGVPDRVAGPVMLQPGGEFGLSIEANQFAMATVRNVTFEVKQDGEGATGKITGSLNGSYDFRTDMLTASGNAGLAGDWPMSPVDGVSLTFKEGGQLDVAVADNVLTRVHGAFPYECTIAAQGTVPEIQLEGTVTGDYSDESKKVSGQLDGTLKNDVVIPVNEDSITIKAGSRFTATVADSVPEEFSVSFDVDYTRQGTLFCSGHVENASYNFRTGEFNFQADLTLKTKVEKQTDDGKWTFVVNEGSQVGVNVENSQLKLLTGSIDFEIHDTEGALFNGQLTSAEIDVQELKFSGTLTLSLARDLEYPRGADGSAAEPSGDPPVQAVAKKDVSTISGSVQNNVLTEVTAALHFGINLGGTEYGAGQVGGTLNMTTFSFSGGGNITLVKDLVLGGEENNAQGEPIATWHLVFPAGQGLAVAVVDNALDEATINLQANLLHNGETVATGSVTGNYKLGDTEGFCGEVNANVIKDVDLTEDERFHYWLETGTSFNATMTDNAIASATGNFSLRMDEIPEGNRPAIKVAIGGGWTAGTGFACEGSITCLNDLKISESGEFSFFVAQGSNGSASVAGTKVTQLSGSLTLNAKKGDDLFAQGIFELSYNATDANTVLNCEGSVQLLQRTDVTPEGGAGDWGFFVCPATGVEFKVTNNDLDYIKGDLAFAVEYRSVESITGAVHVEYMHQAKTVSANGNASVIADMAVAENLPGGLSITIETGTSAAFNVEANDLKTIDGQLNIRIDDEGGPLARVQLGGHYEHTPAPKFDGGGSISLIRDIEVGTSGGGEYSYKILAGTQATCTIAENKLTEITGTLLANVSDGEGEFARLEGTVTASKTDEEWKITAENAGISVTRDKEFDVRGDWTITLCQGSGLFITVRDNEFESLNGTLELKVDKGDELSAKVSLGGEYTPGGGVNGDGRAELLQDYEVGTSEPYAFIVTAGGTEATINVAASAVTRVGGTVNFLVKKGEDDFVTATASIDYDVAGNTLVEASGEGTLATDTTLGDASGFTLVACEGSSAHFLAQNDALINVGGNLNLRLDEGTEPLAEGVVNAEFDVQGSLFTGDGEVHLVRDYAVNAEGLNGHGQPESWGLAIKEGSNLSLAIVENVFQQAHLSVQAVAYHNGEQCADGSLEADYTVGDTGGVSGHVELNVTRRVPLLEGSGRFDYHIDPGSGFSADVAAGVLTSATVTANLAATEGGVDKVLVTSTGSYAAGDGVTANGTIQVVDPILIKEGSEWSVYLDAGSSGSVTVTSSELEEISGNVTLRVDKGGEPFASGEFGITYRVADGENADVTAEGRVTLIGRVEVTPGGGVGGFSVFLCGGSNVGAGLTNGELDYVDGQILGEVEHGGGVWANIDLQARYQASGTEDFSGSGSITTIAPLEVTEFAGYTLFLGVGASITGTITAFELDELTANIPLEMHKDGVKVIEATLGGNYKHADQNFSGEGSVTVVKQITIAEGVGTKGYSFYLEPTSGVSGSVADNAIEQITGSLIVLVSDSASPDAAFLKATAGGTYTGGEEGTFTGGGSLEIIRDFEMLTSASGYVVWLKTGSGASVDVAANELTQIGGTIEIETHKDGAPFAKVSLGGSYTPDGGFDGSGEAELLTEYQVVSDITIGDETYSVWVLEGTGARIDIAASDITHVGGEVHVMIRDGGDFIKIDAQADYDFPGENLGGSGSITVLKPKQLAEFGGNTLWLAEGSGISGSMANNNLERIDGTLNLQLKDEAGHWLTVEFNGGYEPATGFSGEGTVTVLMDKELGAIGNYRFVLAEGGGASATIANNALTEVHGNVPFKVYDAESDPLIVGSAEGHYYAETELFSGSGDVRLGRDVEFPLGAGKLVFKEGSGGGGTVTDNELKELSGTLKVDIHDGEGPMVGCEAEGKYNAVTNKIERASGTARLLRPISVGGEGENAMIRIDQLEGSALVENNELKELSGALTICMPKFNNATGHFEGGWQKGAGGQDIFWGSGWIQVTLFDDPGKGRKASGKVDGTYNKDGTFRVSGNLDYKLTKQIGGSVGMTVDQTLDPVLNGTLEISGVELVPGRDLFKWGKEFNLFQVTAWAGPVPIAISGGVNVGIGLSMLPLTFSASIGVTDFRPLSQDIQVPNFTARAELATGLRLAAKLSPWAQLGVGIAGVASAGLALEGEAGVNVDVGIAPFAELKGQDGQYSGKLGIGCSIVGSGSLAIKPQVYAELLGKRFPYDLTEIRHDLGNLFGYEYNFAFPFGDNPGAAEPGGGGSAPQTAAAATTTSAKHETKPPADPATSGAPNRPAAQAGNPDLNTANNDSAQEGEKEGPMAELMAKINGIQQWGEKIGTVAKVGGELVSMLMFMVTIPFPFGLAVAGGYLAYKLITGALTIDEIVSAATIVWDLIQSIDMSMIAGLLPDWLVALWDQIKGKTWDELLTGMIDTMSEWLSNAFPSAAPVIEALAGVAKTVIQTIARVIAAIMSGSFGLDTFLDICRTVGGAVLEAVLVMVGEAVVGAVADAAGAVVDFVASLW